jgi:hypothetical protein
MTGTIETHCERKGEGHEGEEFVTECPGENPACVKSKDVGGRWACAEDIEQWKIRAIL